MTDLVRTLSCLLSAQARHWTLLAIAAIGVVGWAGMHAATRSDPPELAKQPGTSPSHSEATRSTTLDCIEVRLSDYNLFLLGDYAGGTYVQGRVAAGGNITLKDFAMGDGLAGTAPALVAGGNLSLSNGGVFGTVWYGGGYTDNGGVTVLGGVSRGTPVDFANQAARLHDLSSRLAALPVNGALTREPWGAVLLRGTDPKVNVFDVEAGALDGAVLLSLEAPADSLAVLNIHGTTATFTGSGTVLSGGIDARGVLYHFVEATTLDASGYGFSGTVLAPNADVHFSNGGFQGGLYAKSLTGNAAGYVRPLLDRDLCSEVPGNNPPTVALISPANGASFTAPATVRLEATASDDDDAIAQVELFRDGVPVGTVTAAPYTVTLTDVPEGTYRLGAKATDARGASTASAEVVVTVTASAFRISSPINGASIDSDHVLVVGHIDRQPNSGVTVNGVVAAVDARDDFYAIVPLTEGANTLKATWTPPTGLAQEREVTVVATGRSAPIAVIAEPTVGMAPLTTTFTLTNPTDQPARYRFNGSGPVELPADGSATVSVTYPAGVFTPSFVLETSTGESFSQTFVIEARDEHQMDLLLGAIWNGMNDALLAGEKDKALSYLAPQSQDKYGAVFEKLLPYMPEIIASYSPLTRASLSPTLGEYAIKRRDGAVDRIYFIYFLQGDDGVWRIDSM